MTSRFVGSAVLAISAMLLSGTVVAATRHSAAAVKKTPAPINKVHERLLQLPPTEQAATLAKAVGHSCIGTEAFAMGVVAKGPGEGNAYWSLRCADGTAWAVQIDPFAEVTAIDCASFKEAAQGKECFKKF